MLWNISSSRAAFGTSPPWVKNDHMLPDTTFEQIINLSRNNPEKEMQAMVRLTGDEKLLKWITIPDQENLIMEKGQNVLPMKVIVDVPKRAELRNYRGGIFITLAPVVSDTLEGGQVAINLGANILVDITVIGEEVVDYRVVSVSSDPIQEKNPLSFKIKIENLGNVSIDNIEGQIEIHNKAQTEILESLDFVPLDDSIAPDETNIVRMIFEDTILDPGQYWIFVKSIKDGEIEFEDRLFQEITKKVVPVITPEDITSKKPSLPGDGEEADVMPPAVQVPVSDLRPAAPAEASNVYLIFGLAGLGLGLIGIIGLIVVLIIVLKNQQKPAINGYPAQGQPAQPQAPPSRPAQSQAPQDQPAQDQPAQNRFENTTEGSKIDEKE